MSLLLPKPRPKVLDKRDTQRDAERLRRQVYAEVDARDCRRCRCCGRKGNPYATTALERIHRHHLEERGRDGGPMATWNILSLCALCHSLVHAKQLWVKADGLNKQWIRAFDANKSLRFEIHEAAVVEVFGSQVLPANVRMVK